MNYRYGLVMLAGVAGSISPAFAQNAPAPVSAETSSAPTLGSLAAQAYVDPYAPKGIPVGGFRLFPTIEAVGDYDDNIYLSHVDQKASFFSKETPGLLLRSDWSRHQVEIYESGSFYQYANYGGQDHIDWNAGGDGRLDIYQGLNLTANGSYTEEHIANSSPDQPITVKSPTEFAVTESGATLAYNPYHFGFDLGGTFARYVYNESKLVGGGTSDNSDRNSDLYTAFAKASYEVSPGYAVFAQATGNSAGYDERFDRSGEVRANHGFTANAGVDMLVTNLIRGQAFVGYLDQRYEAPFKDVSGIDFGANVDWYVSTLWTLHLVGARNLTNTTLINASAEDDRQAQLSADYRLTSYIVMTGSVTYLDASFDGSNRDDQYITGRVQAVYHLNPWIGVTLSDAYQTRSSTVAGQSFNDNIVTLGLQFQE